MTRRIQVHQVDAFTREPFTGNPTGVVLNADALSEAQMLAIARELNNAETAFILAPDGTDHTVRARFFTPRAQARFVGHASAAADRGARARAPQAAETRPGAAHDALGADRRGRLLCLHPDTGCRGPSDRVAHVLPGARHRRGSGERQRSRPAGGVPRAAAAARSQRRSGALL